MVEKEKGCFCVMVRLERVGIIGWLVRMGMCNDASIGQKVAVQKDGFVDNQQPHKDDDQTSNSLFGSMLNCKFHYAANVPRFCVMEIPNYRDIAGLWHFLESLNFRLKELSDYISNK